MAKEYPKWKRYLWSSLITFLAAFLTTLGTMMTSLDSLSTLENLSWSVIAGVLMTAVRAGCKALWEDALKMRP